MKQKNTGGINRSLTKMQRRALAEALERDKPRLKTQTIPALKKRGIVSSFAVRLFLPALLIATFSGLIKSRVYGEDIGIEAFLFLFTGIGCVTVAIITAITLRWHSKARVKQFIYFSLLGLISFLLFYYSPQFVIWGQVWRVQHEEQFVKCRELASGDKEPYRICDTQDVGGAVVSNEFRYFVYDASDAIQGAPCMSSGAWEIIAKKHVGLTAYQSEVTYLADHFYLVKVIPSFHPITECD